MLTVAVPSPERITPRSTVLLPTLLGGLPSLLFTPSSLAVLWFSSRTPLVSLSLFPSSLRPTALQKRAPTSLSRSFGTTSTSALVSLSRSWILLNPSTSRLLRTVTSPTRISPGRSPRPSSSKGLACLSNYTATLWGHSVMI